MDRVFSVFIPELGWFEGHPGDPICNILEDAGKASVVDCVASGKITIELSSED